MNNRLLVAGSSLQKSRPRRHPEVVYL